MRAHVSVCVCLCTYMHRFVYTNIHTHPPAPAPSFLSWPALTNHTYTSPCSRSFFSVMACVDYQTPCADKERSTEAIAKGARTREDGRRHDKASRRPKEGAQKVREDSQHVDRHPFFAELENARTRVSGKVEGKEGRIGGGFTSTKVLAC